MSLVDSINVSDLTKEQSSTVWLRLLPLVSKLTEEKQRELGFTIDEIYRKAATDTLYDIADGSKVWKLYYERASLKEDAQKLDQLWIDRLSVPSLDIQDLYDDYSTFVSENFFEVDYVNKMRQARTIESKMEKIANRLEKFELALAEDVSNPQAWLKYMDYCYKRLKSSEFRVPLTKAVFKRMCDYTSDAGPEWIALWEKYCSYHLEANMAQLHERMAVRMSEEPRVIKQIIRDYSSYIEDMYKSRAALEVLAPKGNSVERIIGELVWRINRIDYTTADVESVSYLLEKSFLWSRDNGITDVGRACIETLKRFRWASQLPMMIHRYLGLDNEISTTEGDWIFCLDEAIGSCSDETMLGLFEKCAHMIKRIGALSSELSSRWKVFRNVYVTKDQEFPMDEALKMTATEEPKVSAFKRPAPENSETTSISNKRVKKEGYTDKLSLALSQGREVYVTDIGFQATEELLRTIFGESGQVETVKLPFRKNRGISSRHNDGFAYVSYLRKDDADNAIKMLDGRDVGGRKIHVSIAEVKKVHLRRVKGSGVGSNFNRERTVAVLNISPSIKSGKLKQALEEVGKITQFEEFSDKHAVLVEFSTQREAGMASLKLDGQKLDSGGPLRIGTINDLRRLT
ncbi:DEKNAAC101303 [Brettanomyces naardenensis]|uniref:DEKNAAC101303 n=1 Tax=Brettanomyces naardenensis TaxID=13370 RepID=A0A448YI33_BRENA|nr:DEKNAAC101303 [Brettanomyces naardenensis]